MTTVVLRIYDLSQGMAQQLSPAFLGKQIDGIWHTGIHVFDREYYFGGGICCDPPGQTPYGTPHTLHPMGTTTKTKEQFLQFLATVSSRFTMHSYHLLDNNCNNFTDECAKFLLGRNIPSYVLDLPKEAMDSPMGAMLRPMIDQMQASIRDQSMGHQLSLPGNLPSASATSSARVSPAPNATLSTPTASNKYWKTPITLSSANRPAILRKLAQFDPSFSPSESPSITKLLSAAETHPPQTAFPVLDLLRLSALESQHATAVAEKLPNLMERFVTASDTHHNSQMMALRLAVNLFSDPKSAAILCQPTPADAITEAVAFSLESEKPQVRKPAALLALNFAGASFREKQINKPAEDHVVRLLYAAVARLNATDKPEANEAGPLLQTIVVLVEDDADNRMLLSAFGLDLESYCSPDSCPEDDLRKAAVHLRRLLETS